MAHCSGRYWQTTLSTTCQAYDEDWVVSMDDMIEVVMTHINTNMSVMDMELHGIMIP